MLPVTSQQQQLQQQQLQGLSSNTDQGLAVPNQYSMTGYQQQQQQQQQLMAAQAQGKQIPVIGPLGSGANNFAVSNLQQGQQQINSGNFMAAQPLQASMASNQVVATTTSG